MKPVAEISRTKAVVLRHTGVLLPDGRVAHNTPAKGEHISTIEDFAAGHDVSIDYVVPPSEHTAVLQRVQQGLRTPKAYDLFQNNCEVFKNRMLAREPVSPQLRFALFGMAVAALVLCVKQ